MTGKAKGMKRSGFSRASGQEEFWRAVTEGKPCWFNNADCSDWPLWHCDAHHLIPKEAINSHFDTMVYRYWGHRANYEAQRTTALSSPANGIPVCRFHHSQLENHRIYIARDELPEAVFAFAKDYGLEALLDRAYPERETDAA